MQLEIIQNKESTMNTSTTAKIQKWLINGHKITPLQALKKWGCMRLAARIAELRARGMIIKTKPVTKNGKTFAQYSL